MSRRVRDLMQRGVKALTVDASVKEVARAMSTSRSGALPVVDGAHRVVGVVSEADLILKDEEGPGEPWLLERRSKRDARRKFRATTAAELMTAPPVITGPDADVADVARLMRERRVKYVPVCDPDGRLLGVVSRLDLVAEFVRDDSEIQEEARRVLQVEMSVPGVRCQVREGVITLEGSVEHRSQVPGILERIHRVAGSVDVIGRLNWTQDDLVPVTWPSPWVGP